MVHHIMELYLDKAKYTLQVRVVIEHRPDRERQT